MSKPSQGLTETADGRFVAALATFVKACFVYPENNVRVREASAGLFEQFRQLALRGDGVGIKVSAERVYCMGAPLEPPFPPMVQWLKATLESTALAGIELESDVAEPAMFAFARRLRENFSKARHAPSFAALWSQPIAGLRFIEPRFRGRFAAKPTHGGDQGFADSPATESMHLRGTLHEHPGIRAKLDALQEAFAQRADARDAAEERGIDVVHQIVQIVPEEVRSSPAALAKTVESVLAIVVDELRHRAPQPAGDHFDFTKLVLGVCRTFFLRDTTAEGAPAAGVDQRHDHWGDRLIADDLGALLQEIAGLPAAVTQLELEESSTEQIGVYLHQFVSSTALEHVAGLKPRIVERLALPGPGELAVVAQYAAAETHAGGQQRRLLDLLRDSRLTQILRSTPMLSSQTVVAEFPRRFCLFLDALDPEDPVALDELAETAGRLSRDLVLRKASSLLEDGILEEDRLRKLLLRPAFAVLSFAELAVRHGDLKHRGLVVQYLRKLDLTEPAAAALCLDEVDLPASFLCTLCQEARQKESSPQAFRTAVHLIREFLAAAATTADAVTRQAYAVYALRKLWSEETRDLVKRLARRWVNPARAYPRPVRAAARELLKQSKGR